MRSTLRSILFVLAGVPLVLALSGCGGDKKVKASGRLLDKGQPLTAPGPLPPGDVGIRVTFYPTEASQGQEPQQAVVSPDGTFQLSGNDGKGIVPGKYRVAIIVGAVGKDDKLKGVFGEKNSPIYREVTGGVLDDIDIAEKK
jgi:hypothetical protein